MRISDWSSDVCSSDLMVFGTHGSTYGGNPLAMAAGEAVLDVILEPGFLDHVEAMGERLRASLEQLIPNYDSLFDSVRGRGLLQGLRLKQPSRDFRSEESRVGNEWGRTFGYW